MTERIQQIARAILDALAGFDAPAPEPVIFGLVAARVHAVTMGEFDDAMADCDRERWVTGDNDKLKGKLWSITTKGIHARRK